MGGIITNPYRYAVSGGGGLPAGTLLLGHNDLVASPNDFTGNPNTVYYMRCTAAETAQVATAWFYDRLGYELNSVHLLIYGSTGTLLGTSPAFTLLEAAGWRSVAWSGGPSLTQGTTYYLGINTSNGSGFFTNYDTSSPTSPAMTPSIAATYGSEGNITIGSVATNGSYTVYVTN